MYKINLHSTPIRRDSFEHFEKTNFEQMHIVIFRQIKYNNTNNNTKTGTY